MSIAEADVGYVLTNPDGSSQEFDAYGRLSGETDRNGNDVRIQRGDDGIIEEIISPTGCSIKVKTDGTGHITAISLLQDGKETGRRTISTSLSTCMYGNRILWCI